MTSTKTLAVVLARGGSKGIKRKNLMFVGGKPLVVRAVDCAMTSAAVDHVVCSTEDEEIARFAELAGATVIDRPQELAEDHVWSRDVLLHVVPEAEKIFAEVTHVVELPCTAPLRTADDVTVAVRTLHQRTDLDSVTSIVRVHDKHPVRMKRLDEEGLVGPFCDTHKENESSRRQDLEPCYIRNGAIYAMTRECLMEKRSRHGDRCWGYLMPEERSVNIDTPIDLKIAEALYRESVH